LERTSILFESGPIATLTINRPAALNALNRAVIDEIREVIDEMRADPAIRVLIVTGAGDRAFVAGADIAAMAAMSPIEGLDFAEAGHRVMDSLESLPIPVIAAVNGFALGGGLELALACDLIVAVENARFGQPEVNLGLIPGFGGTQRLARRIGLARAREAILTGDLFDAKNAYEWGLVNRLVAPGNLMAEVNKLAGKIAAKSAVALRQAKAALRAAMSSTQETGLAFEREAFGVVFGSADRIEGTTAFVQKRPPKWTHA
jgi:enoyl-CoA hydratase